jgi:hypothetical protein
MKIKRYEIKYRPQNKYLEDYLTIFPDLEDSNAFGYVRYKESIQPVITIAHYSGFSFMKD